MGYGVSVDVAQLQHYVSLLLSPVLRATHLSRGWRSSCEAVTPEALITSSKEYQGELYWLQIRAQSGLRGSSEFSCVLSPMLNLWIQDARGDGGIVAHRTRRSWTDQTYPGR
ncbi:unnamed protein product [Gadus morhua 'NCC']